MIAICSMVRRYYCDSYILVSVSLFTYHNRTTQDKITRAFNYSVVKKSVIVLMMVLSAGTIRNQKQQSKLPLQVEDVYYIV